MANLKLDDPNVVEKVQGHFKKVCQAGEHFTELHFGKEVMIRPIDTRSDNEKLEEIFGMARSFGYTHVLHIGEED